jgi:hypothetical protein
MDKRTRKPERGPVMMFSVIFLTLTIFFLTQRVHNSDQFQYLVFVFASFYIAGMLVIGYRCNLDITNRKATLETDIIFSLISMSMIVIGLFAFLLVEVAYISAILFPVLFIFWEVVSTFARWWFR